MRPSQMIVLILVQLLCPTTVLAAKSSGLFGLEEATLGKCSEQFMAEGLRDMLTKICSILLEFPVILPSLGQELESLSPKPLLGRPTPDVIPSRRPPNPALKLSFSDQLHADHQLDESRPTTPSPKKALPQGRKGRTKSTGSIGSRPSRSNDPPASRLPSTVEAEETDADCHEIPKVKPTSPRPKFSNQSRSKSLAQLSTLQTEEAG